MTVRLIGTAIGLIALLSGGAAPARAQFAAPSYPVIVVPPPQNYSAPKPESRTAPSKAKPSADEPQPSEAPTYHGQTRQLNRY